MKIDEFQRREHYELRRGGQGRAPRNLLGALRRGGAHPHSRRQSRFGAAFMILTAWRMRSVTLLNQVISSRSRTPLDRPLKSNFTIQIKSLKLTVVTGSAACCEDGLRPSARLLKILGATPLMSIVRRLKSSGAEPRGFLFELCGRAEPILTAGGEADSARHS